jgi:hypothetical protein
MLMPCATRHDFIESERFESFTSDDQIKRDKVNR